MIPPSPIIYYSCMPLSFLQKEHCSNCGQYFHCVASHWSSLHAGDCKGHNLRMLQFTCITPNIEDLRSHSPASSLFPLGDLGWALMDVEQSDLPVEQSDSPMDLEESTNNEDLCQDAAFIYRNTGITWEKQLREELDPNNPYFPFANEAEWEFAAWVNQTGLLHNDLDRYFHLQYVRLCLPYLHTQHADTLSLDSRTPFHVWMQQDIVEPNGTTSFRACLDQQDNQCCRPSCLETSLNVPTGCHGMYWTSVLKPSLC
jgi:hypothetical protein